MADEKIFDVGLRFDDFCEALLRASDFKKDSPYVSETVEPLFDASLPFNDKDAQHAFIGSAVTMLTDFLELMTDEEIEIKEENPVLWIAARRAIIGWNILLLAPRIQIMDGVSTLELFRQTATYLTICLKSVDGVQAEGLEEEIGNMDADALRSLGRPLYFTMMCGKGAAWLAYIDKIGAYAAGRSSEVWTSLKDADAVGWQRIMMNYFREQGQLDDREAADLIDRNVNFIVRFFDQFQATQFAMFSNIEDDALFTAGNFVPDTDGGFDLAGWCKVFQVSPYECVSLLTARVLREVRILRQRELQEALEGQKSA